MLIVGMTGVKMGDRMLQIDCADGGALAAVAAKVGLSGRAVAVVPDVATAVRARKAAERQGVLVEVEVAPPTALPMPTRISTWLSSMTRRDGSRRRTRRHRRRRFERREDR